MFNQTLYHGTEKDRGYRMLSNNKMEVSRGDRHWLGDGAYFFEESFFSYKWIIDMYYAHSKRDPKNNDELLERYLIIQATIAIRFDRIFNMDTFGHKAEFDKVYRRCRQLQQYSKRLQGFDIAEGVILNIMFTELQYDKSFDIVMCTFKQKESKYKKTNIRKSYIPQKQVCIKNDLCIIGINIFDYMNDLEGYMELMQEYNRKLEDITNQKEPYLYLSSRKRMY